METKCAITMFQSFFFRATAGNKYSNCVDGCITLSRDILKTIAIRLSMSIKRILIGVSAVLLQLITLIMFVATGDNINNCTSNIHQVFFDKTDYIHQSSSSWCGASLPFSFSQYLCGRLIFGRSDTYATAWLPSINRLCICISTGFAV